MATIKGMLDRVKNAKNGISTQMPEIVMSLKEEILDLNRKQLANNTNSLGEKIGYYKPSTEGILLDRYLLGENVRLKKAGDPFDFQQTGEFFSGFDLYYESGQLEIFSRDIKGDMLNDKYFNLYGLTKKNTYYYQYILIKPRLLSFIKGVING